MIKHPHLASTPHDGKILCQFKIMIVQTFNVFCDKQISKGTDIKRPEFINPITKPVYETFT